MSIFPLRRRSALSELHLPDEDFEHLSQGVSRRADEPGPVDEPDEPQEPHEPQDPIEVSAVNELATSLVEHDIADAVRADNPPPPVEPMDMPAPLSQRHLETIDRMVAHLKGDEKRLEQQILEAKRQLADTQLARHGYERNSTELRRGIAALMRLANVRPPAPRQPRPARASSEGLHGPALGEAGEAPRTAPKPHRPRKMH
jgi:hypothetical protein